MDLRRAVKIVAMLMAIAYAGFLFFFLHETKGPGLLWLVSRPIRYNIFVESAKLAFALVGIGSGVVLFPYYIFLAIRVSLNSAPAPKVTLRSAILGIAFALGLLFVAWEMLSLERSNRSVLNSVSHDVCWQPNVRNSAA
jgi:hypothetical protein